MKANLAKWNEACKIHAKSSDYDMEGFLKGNNSLHEIELESLGNVKDKTLLHLQCQFGMDTLSWARLGARVTGVDFSDKSINLANELNEHLNLPAKFICSNIYDLPEVLDEEFDIVFTSYGVLCWLPDIEKWASIVSRYLKRGGTFFIAEFHPFLWIFDDENPEKLEYKYPYFYGEEPLHYKTEYTYTEQEEMIENVDNYNWQHTFSKIITSLIEAGLKIQEVKEYPFTFFPQYQFMEKEGRDIWTFKDNKYNLPMVFSIKAIKE
ncbi:MAG: Ubiquinone biosynthesis O-methyltransferase [Candidatus Heimdallarchaeota archaeon AB_125]|nr:MAG: Ubiquinone biosynthesis O-methyltransferase [Candidatus Heimdallarchaeota archaeon AB_125]